MIKEIEFIGIQSGDYEAQCFDIDKETFIRLEGEEPRKHDKSYFNKGTYRYYPFCDLDINDGKKYKVSIRIEEIEK